MSQQNKYLIEIVEWHSFRLEVQAADDDARNQLDLFLHTDTL